VGHLGGSFFTETPGAVISGGGGGTTMVAGAQYSGVGLDVWQNIPFGPFEWASVLKWNVNRSEGGFAYLEPDDETFVFPADSWTVVTGSLVIGYTGGVASVAGVANGDTVLSTAPVPDNTAAVAYVTLPANGSFDNPGPSGPTTQFSLLDVLDAPDATAFFAVVNFASFTLPP
jgi:hypothetical protein